MLLPDVLEETSVLELEAKFALTIAKGTVPQGESLFQWATLGYEG